MEEVGASPVGVAIGSTSAGPGDAWSADGADQADGGGVKRGDGGSGSGADTGTREVRKPVTGEAHTGEADGMSGAMAPEAASRDGVGT